MIGCCNEPQLLRGLAGNGEGYGDVTPDIVAGVVAFTAPIAYEHFAPKRWPKPGLVGTIVGVFGVYVLARFTYTRVTA